MQILLGMTSLFGPHTLWSLRMRLPDLVQLARAAGYNGIEYFPLRMRAASDVLQGNVPGGALDFIKTGHQSFRSEKTVADIIYFLRRHGVGTLPLVMWSRLFLPERRDSMGHLSMLAKMKRDYAMPMNIYPYHDGQVISGKLWTEEQNPNFDDFHTKLFQPEVGQLHRWKVANLEELVARGLGVEGFDGLTLDLAHIRDYTVIDDVLYQFRPWSEVLDIALPYTKELHVRFISGAETHTTEADSANEFVDFTSGRLESVQAQMLRAIVKSGWEGPIAVELPTTTLKSSPSVEGPLVTQTEFVDIHSRIVASLRKLTR